jgi:hypothetical protein
MKVLDPTTMSAAERLAELGELLAAGVQRYLARERKAIPSSANCEERLDVLGGSEAPCRATTELPA